MISMNNHNNSFIRLSWLIGFEPFSTFSLKILFCYSFHLDFHTDNFHSNCFHGFQINKSRWIKHRWIKHMIHDSGKYINTRVISSIIKESVLYKLVLLFMVDSFYFPLLRIKNKNKNKIFMALLNLCFIKNCFIC